jgi:hypothetical protein
VILWKLSVNLFDHFLEVLIINGGYVPKNRCYMEVVDLAARVRLPRGPTSLAFFQVTEHKLYATYVAGFINSSIIMMVFLSSLVIYDIFDIRYSCISFYSFSIFYLVLEPSMKEIKDGWSTSIYKSFLWLDFRACIYILHAIGKRKQLSFLCYNSRVVNSNHSFKMQL